MYSLCRFDNLRHIEQWRNERHVTDPRWESRQPDTEASLGTGVPGFCTLE